MRKRRLVHLLMALIGLTLLGRTLFGGGQEEGRDTEELREVRSVDRSLAQELPSGELEIFSWWAGTEGVALEVLIELYEESYPETQVVNATVAGGAGTNARAVLQTRLLGGNPPDSFQVHAGRELIGTWVAANRMQDLSPLFEEQGWMEGVFPPELMDLISTESGIWSVPLTIHRSNVLWYSPVAIDSLGVKVPATWDEFLDSAPSIQEEGVTPLVVAMNWSVQHLWESVALDLLGPDQWNALWGGELPFDSETMIDVWARLDEILEYTNKDASSLSWQQAADRILNGQAAFYVMGDWAEAYMRNVQEKTPQTDYEWEPSPGTDGQFMLLSDSFGMPVGVPHPVNTYHYLALVGSREGQDAFNPLKGSISARVDSELDNYGVYSHSAAEDFRDDILVGSLVHGAVANEGFMKDFATVMAIFLSNRNPEQAAKASQAIADQNNIGE